MASADGIFVTAGLVTFGGSFIESKGFPANGYAIIGGTVGLAFLAALTKNTPIGPPVKALAWLTLLVAVYVSVPAFTRKAKKNG